MRLIAPLSIAAACFICATAACAVGSRQVGGFEENSEAGRGKVDAVDVAESARVTNGLADAGASDVDQAALSTDAVTRENATADAAVEVAQCMREIEFGQVRTSNLYCVTNESVANAKGVLRYPCGKSDNITVTFGKQTFRGSIEDNRILLTNVETFRFLGEANPSCRWRSTQFLSGSLEQGPLTYEYTEAVVTPGLCVAKPCVTSGSVQVTKISKEVSAPR
jgi:hypothetical protein